MLENILSRNSDTCPTYCHRDHISKFKVQKKKHPKQLYEDGKRSFIRSQYLDAYEKFLDYKQTVDNNKSSIEPIDDLHLYYLAVSYHEAEKGNEFTIKTGYPAV